MRLSSLLLLLLLAACHPRDAKKVVTNNKFADTLPNGLRIVNTIDSPVYYKEQVSTDSLKGNYQLVYAEDDSNRYVFLKKGEKYSLLDKCSPRCSFWSLGLADADEEGYFVLTHD